VDQLDKRFFAVAAEPSTYIPLVQRYLRGGPGSESQSIRVGPLAPWADTRAPFADAARISPDGPPSAPLTSRFDFRFFNVAPIDQQLDLLRATADVRLEGLMPGGRNVETSLPGLVPKVFYLRDGLERAGAMADPVALRCDTLWIHTDRAIMTLTWRGVLVERDEATQPCVVVALQARGEESAWRIVRTHLDRAIVARAVEAVHLRQMLIRAPFGAGSEIAPPLSAKRFHDVSSLRSARDDEESGPISETRSMLYTGAAAGQQGRPKAAPAAEPPRPATPASRGFGEQTIDAPYEVSTGASANAAPPRPFPADEPTPAPETGPATSFRPEPHDLIPLSDRTVTKVFNPLYTPDAQRAPAPPPVPSAEAPTAPAPAARPVLPTITDEPTETMTHDLDEMIRQQQQKQRAETGEDE
jgi:hypothetical protein